MDQETQIKKYSGQLERVSWVLVFFGMLTQLSTHYAFPSYNVALGFWGAYSAFSRHGRATFGFIMFAFFGMCLDVAFCSNNRHESSIFTFCLTMFIFCLFCKAYALYQASRFFTSIGGAYSLESSNMSTSMYDSLRASEHDQRATYYPPDEAAAVDDDGASKSLMMSGQSVGDSGVTAVTSNRGHGITPGSGNILQNMTIHGNRNGDIGSGGGMRNLVGNNTKAPAAAPGGRIMLSSSSIMQDPEAAGGISDENARVF